MNVNRLVFINAPTVTSVPALGHVLDVYCPCLLQTLHQVKGLIRAGIEVLSAVEHTDAEVLSELIGVKIPVNKIDYSQKEGDLVVCLRLRTPREGRVLRTDLYDLIQMRLMPLGEYVSLQMERAKIEGANEQFYSGQG